MRTKLLLIAFLLLSWQSYAIISTLYERLNNHTTQLEKSLYERLDNRTTQLEKLLKDI